MNRKFLSLCRTLHIYLTVFGLMVMLLFGITGFTINHEYGFGATSPRVLDVEGAMARDLISKNDNLRIVEALRTQFSISGAVTAYDDLGDRIGIGFKEPGQIWEVEIEKTTGSTKVHRETFNWIALLNNLHRGRYAGPAWRWILDITAVLIALACFTGLILWLSLPKRRMLGIAALAAGTVGLILFYIFLVPGGDSLPQTAAPEPVANRPL